MARSLASSLRTLRKDQRGVSIIEFGLAMPVLAVLIVMGLDLTNLVIANHRIRAIAAMTADNASRLRTQMSEEFIKQLFVGVEKAGEPINFKTQGRVILSSIQNNEQKKASKKGQWIRWQRCFGDITVNSAVGPEGFGKNDNDLPNASGLTAQAGSAIMFAEVSYDYKPLFPNGLIKAQRIEHAVAYIVRQRTDFGISGSSPATC